MDVVMYSERSRQQEETHLNTENRLFYEDAWKSLENARILCHYCLDYKIYFTAVGAGYKIN